MANESIVQTLPCRFSICLSKFLGAALWWLHSTATARLALLYDSSLAGGVSSANKYINHRYLIPKMLLFNWNIFVNLLSSWIHPDFQNNFLYFEMKWCFRPPFCTLFRINWAKQATMRWHGPEWVRTSDQKSSTLPLDYCTAFFILKVAHMIDKYIHAHINKLVLRWSNL